ncbi:MAG: translation elongation factor Ts [bacterium]|nr:translation elongation factor Ts [bacterium]
MITSEQIKQLRGKTGVSVMACKKALEEAGGDAEKALVLLSERGLKVAEAKSERATKAGIIDSYIHPTKQIGVLLELRSETDFVAKNSEFQTLAHDISMHIAASCPNDVHELMTQPYIKNPDIAVGDYITEAVQKFGENIEIARFSRFSV